MQGLEMGRQRRMMAPITDAQGNVIVPDPSKPETIQAVNAELMRRGGGLYAADYMKSMLPYYYGDIMGKQAAQLLMGGGTPAAPGQPYPGEPGAQPAPEPQPQTQPRPQYPSNNHPQGAGPSNIDPAMRPAAAPSGASPVTEGAASAPTVRQVARATGDDTAVAGLARALRVGPDQALTADQVKTARTWLQQRARGQASPVTGPSSEDVNQPTGPVSAAERSFQPFPQNQGAAGAPAPVTAATTPETAQPRPTGIQPQPQPRGGPQVAQAQPGAGQPAAGRIPGSLPPGYTMHRADQLDAEAQRNQAAAAYISRTPGGKPEPFLDRAKQLHDQANQIREAITKQGQNVFSEWAKRSTKVYDGLIAQQQQFDRDLQPMLTLSRKILEDPRMYTGIGGDMSLLYNRVKSLMGDRSAAQLQESFKKITATSVLSQLNVQRDQIMESGAATGRIFQQQVNLVMDAAPQLGTSIAGNLALINILERMGGLSRHVARMATEYVSNPDGPGILDPNFDRMAADWLEKNAPFKSTEDVMALSAPNVPHTVRTAADLRAWEKDMGLKKGDAIRTPGGIKYIP
jgi:hypothetical protein